MRAIPAPGEPRELYVLTRLVSDAACNNGVRVAPLTRHYPVFRKLARREGERQWTYVTYDFDAEGVRLPPAMP